MASAVESLAHLLEGLPPEPREADLFPELQRAVAASPRPLVVVDDDPTGVQTVYDAPVLLAWDTADLRARLAAPDPVVFLLTNSRSLPAEEAARINRALARELSAAREGSVLPMVSRSDSTLRGHYPTEVDALAEGAGIAFDGHLLVPAFFEGARYTIADTHWVGLNDGPPGSVVPADATPFARDAVFGYRSAFLPAWVEEESGGRWHASEVQSVPLDVVRLGPEAVRARLMEVCGGAPVVVNAAGYGDLAAFVLGLLHAESAGKRFLYRTAASFVRLRAGLEARPLLTGAEIYAACASWGTERGPAGEHGLVVVGSHVPAATQQLGRLLATARLPLVPIEVPVASVLSDAWSAADAAARIDTALQSRRLPVLFTSRDLRAGSGDESLRIGRRVSDALVDTLARVRVRPRFVVAKGGITSHDIAQRGLGARRALVLGQLLPGVPVWCLEQGPALRFPGIPFVVFPGNVGGPESLARAVEALAGACRA